MDFTVYALQVSSLGIRTLNFECWGSRCGSGSRGAGVRTKALCDILATQPLQNPLKTPGHDVGDGVGDVRRALDDVVVAVALLVLVPLLGPGAVEGGRDPGQVAKVSRDRRLQPQPNTLHLEPCHTLVRGAPSPSGPSPRLATPSRDELLPPCFSLAVHLGLGWSGE